MKKTMLAVAGIALLAALFPAVALAGPPSQPDYGAYNPTGLPNQPPEEWGVEKALPSHQAPGGAVRIITDALVGGGGADGWVTFWCQSRLGFQYNIGATGLDPKSRYSVRAEGVSFEFALQDPGLGPLSPQIEPGLWILVLTATPVDLDLGTFQTDANGSGGVKGVARLPSGYVYEVAVVVSDSDGIPVLGPAPSPPPFPPGPDTNGFIVY